MDNNNIEQLYFLYNDKLSEFYAEVNRKKILNNLKKPEGHSNVNTYLTENSEYFPELHPELQKCIISTYLNDYSDRDFTNKYSLSIKQRFIIFTVTLICSIYFNVIQYVFLLDSGFCNIIDIFFDYDTNRKKYKYIFMTNNDTNCCKIFFWLLVFIISVAVFFYNVR